MKKFECKCGNRKFFVDKNKTTIKCTKCYQHYDFNRIPISGKWKKSVKFIKKAIGKIFKPRKPKPKPKKPKKKKFVREKETLKEFKQRIGAKKPKKPKKEKEKIKIQAPTGKKDYLKKKKLWKKWQPYLKRLKAGERMEIGKNEHFGSLRGQAIARKAQSDLKTLGFEVKAKYKNNKATIWLK